MDLLLQEIARRSSPGLHNLQQERRAEPAAEDSSNVLAPTTANGSVLVQERLAGSRAFTFLRDEFLFAPARPSGSPNYCPPS